LTEGGTGTVWTGEIADNHERVTLIVARFDLERWLDGTMLHTLFITSPQDILKGYYQWQSQESGKRCHEDVKVALEEREVPAASWDMLRQALSQLADGQQEKKKWTETLNEFTGKRKAYRELEDKRQRWLEEIASPNTHPGKRADLERRLKQVESQMTTLKGELHSLEATLMALPTLEAAVYHHLTDKSGQVEKRVEVIAEQLQKQYGIGHPNALLLSLARKNPSASRLLRVWQTTEDFLKEQAKGLKKVVKERQRVVFTLDKPPPPPGIYKANVPILGRIDVFVRPEDGKVQSINFLTQALRPLRERLQEKKLHFVTRERGRSLNNEEKEPLSIQDIELEPYLPYQVITVSPNLLLMMVPADKAMEVAEKMQRDYAEEFGKVRGRLPFHVGLIFMDDHYPMFAALDTARRLGESFDSLAEEHVEATLEEVQKREGAYTLKLHSDRFGAWTWHVPAQRGDRKTDWYHPYFLVQQGKDLDKRGMSLEGPKGRWEHVSQLQEGDKIAFWPNLFDFIFLDTVSRRLEAQLDQETRRRSHPLLGAHHSPRPYLLERVRHLSEVWKAIRKADGMSETRLEGATSLLARKWEAWQLASADSPERQETWKTYSWLVDQVAARDFGKKKEIRKTIKEAVLDGSFFDTVELYRHILKKKVVPVSLEKKEEVME
jgi:hypothetical protein